MTWSSLKGVGAAGTGAINVALPVGWAADDYCLLMCESNAGQAVTAPSGWTEVAGSPVEDSAASTRLTVFGRRLTSSEVNPVPVADSGDHTLGVIYGLRGAVTSGAAIRITSTQSNPAGTFVEFPAITAESYDWILAICGHGRDSTSATQTTPYGCDPDQMYFASITGDGTNQGGGGGLFVIQGIAEQDGVIDSIYSTLAVTLSTALMVIAVKPATPIADATLDIAKGFLGFVVDTEGAAVPAQIAKGFLGFVVDTEGEPPTSMFTSWRAYVN